MSNDDALRAIARYLDDADKRERAADERSKALTAAVTKGFETLVKELHEGFTLIQHTIIDELRRR